MISSETYDANWRAFIFFDVRDMLLGLIALAAGSVVYLSRPSADSALFIQHLNLFTNDSLPLLPNIYGGFADYAADFFHPLAFSFITMAFCTRLKTKIVLCINWLAIDLILEFTQGDWVTLHEYMPHWLNNTELAKVSALYFRHGTFDIKDIFAIVLGTLLAISYLILKEKHVHLENDRMK